MVTGTTVVTTGAVETGVKVVATVTGVVLTANFIVVSDSVVTAAVVVAAGGFEIANIKDNQVIKHHWFYSAYISPSQ